MAEEDRSSKTEAPSGRRLDEARRKGDVPKSPDVASVMALTAAVAVLLFYGPTMARSMTGALLPFLDHPAEFDLSGQGAVDVLRMAGKAAMPGLIVLIAAAAAGVAGNLIQHGFLFTPSKLMPSFGKLNPVEGLKRMFGLDGLMAFLKNLLKLIALCVLAWVILKPKAAGLPELEALSPAAILPLSVDMLRSLLYAVLAVMATLAGLDWFWQRQRFMARMRMTRHEVKEEHKDSEGDPHIKAKLKQMRIARAKRRMMQNVQKATVVVTNPTHYAVALRYVSGETAAPLCVAKGVDRVAFKIREMAEAHKVPIIEDPPLARALYAAIDVDESIPREHYEAVAKIIGFVLNAAKRRAQPRRSRL